MAIEFEGITAEQLKLGNERLIFDLENLDVGDNCWIDAEAVWANSEGEVFIDHTSPQLNEPSQEVADSYVVLFRSREGYVIFAPHIPDYMVHVVSRPTLERKRNSSPVFGLVIDRLTLETVNANIIIPEYGDDAEIEVIESDAETNAGE